VTAQVVPFSEMRSAKLAATLSLLGLASTGTRAAHACGSSGPGGVSACSLAEHEEEERPKWRIGISGVATSTALHLSNGLHADETRLASVAALTYAPTSRFSVEASAGAALGGKLTLPDGSHEFSPGPVFGLGASWRVVDGRPFVILTSLLSFTSSTTRTNDSGAPVGYEAFDLRLGGIVGTTLWNRFSPYGLVRAFGGPVYWRYEGAPVTGTDTHHYQVGAGFALGITRRFDLFVEGVPLGEQAVAAGLAMAF
jgi:hypothetical protein